MNTILYIIIPVFALALLYFLMIFPGFKAGRKFENTALICPYAHRGLHGGGVPENSLAAFKKAAEMGFGIELDLQLSADGEVMVFHDYTLARMTGADGKLSDKTARELSELKLAGTNEHIPTLREVLAEINGRVPLLIELKGENMSTALCPAADAILREYEGEYCMESFNPIFVAWYREHRPEIMRGQLYTNVCAEKKITPLNIALTLLMFNFLARPDFIAYNWHYPNPLPLRLVRFLVPHSFTWTVRSAEGFDTAEKYGSHPIFEGELPFKFKK